MTNEEIIETLEEMWELLFKKIRSRVFEELKGTGELDKFTTAFDTAIEALKAEPCEDTISRKSLLSKLDACYDEKKGIVQDTLAEGFVQVEKLIRAEPSANPKQDWIPVSERLPEPQDDADKEYSDTVQVTVHVCRNTDIVRDAYYCFSKGEWYSEGFCIGTVTAWMPLPKPFEPTAEH